MTTQINRIGPGAPSITANSGETEGAPRVTVKNKDLDRRRSASRNRLTRLASSLDHTAGKLLTGIAAAPFVIAGGLATVAVHSTLSLVATPFTLIRDMFKGLQDPVKELLDPDGPDFPEDVNPNVVPDLVKPKESPGENALEIARANDYITAGAKIVDALAKTGSASTVTVDAHGKNLPIRPNIQTLRAAIWYLKAKALTEGGNSDHLIVSGRLAHKLYNFLKSAPTTYNRNGLFGKLFRGQQQQQERGIEDFSNQLPKGKGAVVFDLKNGQLHLKLETAGTPSLFGTSRHSDASWTASVWRSFVTPFRNLRHLWNRPRSENQAAVEVALNQPTASQINQDDWGNFVTGVENRNHGEVRLDERGAVQLENTGWLRRKLKNWFVKSAVRQQREKTLSTFRQALIRHLETFQTVQKNEKLSGFFLGKEAPTPLNPEELADFLLNPAYKRGYLKTKDVTYIRNVIGSDRVGMIETMRRILTDPRFQDKLRELDRSWWQRIRLTGVTGQLPILSQLKDLGGAIQAGHRKGKLKKVINDISSQETISKSHKQLLLLLAEALKNHYSATRNTRLASALLSGAALGTGIGIFGVKSNFLARQLASLVSWGSGTSASTTNPTLRSAPTAVSATGTSLVRWIYRNRNIPDYLFRTAGQDYRTALAMLATLPPSSDDSWTEAEIQLLRALRQAAGIADPASQ